MSSDFCRTLFKEIRYLKCRHKLNISSSWHSKKIQLKKFATSMKCLICSWQYLLGTIQILRKHWTGWMGSEIGHFCLLTVHREWVGGFKIISKNMHTYSPDRQWCPESIHTHRWKGCGSTQLKGCESTRLKGCGSTQDIIDGPDCSIWMVSYTVYLCETS